jgi:hypothetical protein
LAVRQGQTVLSADYKEPCPSAPRAGARRHDAGHPGKPSCSVHYRYLKNGEEIFDFISRQASFEQEWE